jgi:hypothetical protein
MRYFLLLLCAQLAILEVVIDGDVAVASTVMSLPMRPFSLLQ